MTFHFSTRYVALVAVLTLTLVGALTLTGTATAQEVEINETDTPDPIEGTVGPIEIENYELRGSTFVLTVQVSEPTPYALSDALAGTQSEGVTSIPVKQGALDSGRQTLKLDVQVIEGAGAVTLSTPSNAARIQSGSVGIGQQLIPASTVRILVIGTALGAGVFTFTTVRKRREDEEKEAERIL